MKVTKGPITIELTEHERLHLDHALCAVEELADAATKDPASFDPLRADARAVCLRAGVDRACEPAEFKAWYEFICALREEL